MIAGLSRRASALLISILLLLSLFFLSSYHPTVRSRLPYFTSKSSHTAANSPPELLEVNPDLATDLSPELLEDDGNSAKPGSVPSAESSARYIFAFGDSYTAHGFKWDGIKPSSGNPFGNPPYPKGRSSNGLNWIDNLLAKAPENTLCYNLATGAAVVDVTIVSPPLSLIPFPYQVRNFTEHLALDPHPEFAPWNAENSLAVVWFGVNDVAAMQAYTKQATVTELVDRVMESYFDKIRILHSEGLDQFVFMGVPPLFRAPFATLPKYQALDNLTQACGYWNEALEQGTVALRAEFSRVKADVFLVQRTFEKALNDSTTYGAPNATCTQKRNDESCLWVDNLHPGKEIARLVGDAMYDHLVEMGFLPPNTT